jgi:hypothetical protein
MSANDPKRTSPDWQLRCAASRRPGPSRLCLLGSYELTIHPNNREAHPNNREAVAESDCLWPSCTERTRCHISLAVSHQRRRHFLIPLHCLQLNQYQRRLPRLSPHVPPPIQAQHLPERQVRYQRQRYQPQRHSPPGRGIGILSLAERKFGSTDRLLGKTRKTCAGRALPRTMEQLDRYRRIPQT